MNKIERAAINRARLKELYDSGITGYKELQKASGMTVSEFVKGIKAVGISPKTVKEQFSDNTKLILGLYNSGVTTRVGLYHKSGLSYSQVRRVVESLGIEVDTKYTEAAARRDSVKAAFDSGISEYKELMNETKLSSTQLWRVKEKLGLDVETSDTISEKKDTEILSMYNGGVTIYSDLMAASGLDSSNFKSAIKRLGIHPTTIKDVAGVRADEARELMDKGVNGVHVLSDHMGVSKQYVYDMSAKYDLPLKKILRDYREDVKQPCVSNERSLKCMNGKEIDLYFPESKVGVELDGEWWHSERYKDKNYHADKQGLARSGGIKLLQFWVETQWDAKRDICIRMLENALGVSKEDKVGARKCSIVELDKVTAHNFLEEYHIQGYGPSSIRYGLGHNGGLVAVMTFDKNGTLIRYATSQKVMGGFQKLLSHHRKGFNGPIRTFSDNRLFSGDIYKNAGFRLDGELPPDYMYYKSGAMKHKFGFRKEEKARDLDGWVRVYDSGKKRWVLD